MFYERVFKAFAEVQLEFVVIGGIVHPRLDRIEESSRARAR